MKRNSIILGVLVLTISGLVIWDRKTTSIPDSGTSDLSSNEATTTSSGGIEGYNLSGAVVTVEPVRPTREAPSLNRSLTFPSSMPESVREKVRQDIERVTTLLKVSPLNFEGWLSLGLYRHSLEDYRGAEEAWLYASEIDPLESVTFGNLANLYAYQLKKNITAEQYYLKAIELSPELAHPYIQTFDFYHNVLKNDVKARAIIEKAIRNIPEERESLTAFLEARLEN